MIYQYYKIEIKLTQTNPDSEVYIVQIDLFDENISDAYLPYREETYGPIDLTRYSPAPGLIINWEAETPGSTEYKVFTAIANSVEEEPSVWSQTSKNTTVPGINKGDDLTGKYLWIKEVLTTNNTKKTPVRNKLYIEIVE